MTKYSGVWEKQKELSLTIKEQTSYIDHVMTVEKIRIPEIDNRKQEVNR